MCLISRFLFTLCRFSGISGREHAGPASRISDDVSAQRHRSSRRGGGADAGIEVEGR